MKLAFFVAALTLLSSLASAQEIDNRALVERLDRMERDLTYMMRAQESRSATPNITVTGEAVQSGALEEQLRSILGEIEKLQFAHKQLEDKLTKTTQDYEFRIADLEKKLAAASQVAATVPAPEPTTATPEPDTTPAAQPEAEKPKFATPREHYNFAFKLLNQTKYDEAGKTFESFISAYAKDPLIGNAYYWLGETFYVRRDYVHAADNYRLGFEAMPNGPKSADNLLKLSMSLSAMKKKSEACIVLGQIVKKYAKEAGSTKQKAEAERVRIGCE